jgi:hypothetical protein
MLLPLYACPHTTIYASSFYYMCVLILQRLAEKEELELHASSAICVSSYYYIRVSSCYFMAQHLAEKADGLLQLHASSAICVSSYYYIRVSSCYCMVQRLAEKEEMELHAARERIASLKKGNARHLEQMRRQAAAVYCRHAAAVY